MTAKNATACVLFLSGGGLTVGRERFREWQDALARTGISSVSFDYSGVQGSGTSLENSSLESRIAEAVAVTDWMAENVPASRYVLYGVSMGGYIALGLTKERKDFFDALILHAPAAYAPTAHALHFGNDFTSEIRKEHSWEDSLSFGWLQAYTHPVLLIEAEHDEVIPHLIIEKYKNSKQDGKLTVFHLKKIPHAIWGDSVLEKKARSDIYQALEHFVQNISSC